MPAEKRSAKVMAGIITTIVWGELVLLALFLIFALFTKKLRKFLIVAGILALSAGEIIYLISNVQMAECSFQCMLRFSFMPIGYLLLALGFRNVLKEGKKK